MYLSPYYLRGRQFKLDYMLAEFNHPTLGDWYYVRSALLLFQCGVYLTLAGMLLFRYSRELKLKGEARPTPQAERAVLFQVRFMLVGFLILFVGGLLRYTLDQTARTNLLAHRRPRAHGPTARPQSGLHPIRHGAHPSHLRRLRASQTR